MTRSHYVEQLESVRQNLLQMGETTISLLGEAIRAVAECNSGPAARASELEAQTDHQHRLIHDQCLNLITLQAPVARDARFVTGVLDAIVDDLELIGDYAYEVVTLSSGMKRRPPSQISSQIAELGGRVRASLIAAIESWRKEGGGQAVSIRPEEVAVRAECASLYEKLAKLVSGHRDSAVYVDLMLICRHLERILRHAVCLADQAANAAFGRRAD
jgi:phosphate transport system protein